MNTAFKMYKASDKVCDGPRDGTVLGEMNGKLYSFGGWTADPLSVSYNEVYCSSGDLSVWEKMPAAPWEGRHTFGVGKLGDKNYVYGSDAQSATEELNVITGKPTEKPLMDMWLTYDEQEGAIWYEETETSKIKYMQSRCLYGSCSDGAYLYMIGGMDTIKSFRSRAHDVGRYDGNKWTIVGNGLAAFEKNLSGACCCFNGKIYVISGGIYGGKPGVQSGTQEMYSSNDFGANWRREPDIPFIGRQYHNTIVYDNKLWVICGYNGGNLRDIHYMDEQGNWTEFWLPDEFLPRHASGVCVYNNKLVITNGNYHNDCWVIEKVNT